MYTNRKTLVIKSRIRRLLINRFSSSCLIVLISILIINLPIISAARILEQPTATATTTISILQPVTATNPSQQQTSSVNPKTSITTTTIPTTVSVEPSTTTTTTTSTTINSNDNNNKDNNSYKNARLLNIDEQAARVCECGENNNNNNNNDQPPEDLNCSPGQAIKTGDDCCPKWICPLTEEYALQDFNVTIFNSTVAEINFVLPLFAIGRAGRAQLNYTGVPMNDPELSNLIEPPINATWLKKSHIKTPDGYFSNILVKYYLTNLKPNFKYWFKLYVHFYETQEPFNEPIESQMQTIVMPPLNTQQQQQPIATTTTNTIPSSPSPSPPQTTNNLQQQQQTSTTFSTSSSTSVSSTSSSLPPITTTRTMPTTTTTTTTLLSSPFTKISINSIPSTSTTNLLFKAPMTTTTTTSSITPTVIPQTTTSTSTSTTTTTTTTTPPPPPSTEKPTTTTAETPTTSAPLSQTTSNQDSAVSQTMAGLAAFTKALASNKITAPASYIKLRPVTNEQQINLSTILTPAITASTIPASPTTPTTTTTTTQTPSSTSTPSTTTSTTTETPQPVSSTTSSSSSTTSTTTTISSDPETINSPETTTTSSAQQPNNNATLNTSELPGEEPTKFISSTISSTSITNTAGTTSSTPTINGIENQQPCNDKKEFDGSVNTIDGNDNNNSRNFFSLPSTLIIQNQINHFPIQKYAWHFFIGFSLMTIMSTILLYLYLKKSTRVIVPITSQSAYDPTFTKLVSYYANKQNHVLLIDENNQNYTNDAILAKQKNLEVDQPPPFHHPHRLNEIHHHNGRQHLI